MEFCKLIKSKLLRTSFNVLENKLKTKEIFAETSQTYFKKLIRSLYLTGKIFEKSLDDDRCGLTQAALVIGVYVYDEDIHAQNPELTPTADKVNTRLNGKILELLRDGAMPVPKLGKVRTFYGLDAKYPLIVVAGLGDPCKSYNPSEQIEERKEAIRIAAGAGARACQDHSLQSIHVDTMTHAESAAEGSAMAVWIYQEMRSFDQKPVPKVSMFDSCDHSGWSIGLHKASAQNLSRYLCESPGNQLTPSLFTRTVVEILSKSGINVMVRMKHWAALRNLHGFLTVGRGSCESPILLEILYEGCDPNTCPIVIIGKGVTYDAGGLCLKKYKDMDYSRGDMSGAATVVAAIKAVADLQLPLNVVGLIPLCENLPGATAIHPGSIIRNVADKTIMIRNTDDEGVIMLSDTLTYAAEFTPKFIIDIGNYTPQAKRSIGSAASLVFSNNESLYETLRIASIHTGDRIWRLPLWSYFNEYVRDIPVADIKNLQTDKDGGGPCKAAAFLREFIASGIDWLHIDTYGVTTTSGKVYSYLRKGMSGRPTRTIVEMFAQLACLSHKEQTEKLGDH